jgi:hypothetical protein
MTAAHENYIHLLTCIDRLNASWRTLKEIERDLSNPLVGPAFRYALVEYCTAFTRSEGHLSRRNQLSHDLVPVDFRELHNRVLAARHTVHAHADLKPLDAELYIGAINGEKYVGVTKNHITGLEELANISQLVALIEGVLDRAIDMDRALEQSIEP